jgi:hypothetical protein
MERQLEQRWLQLLRNECPICGNFVLSLTDHASNGFFARSEWIPVISSACATGFLIVPLVPPVTRRFLDVCLLAMGVQALRWRAWVLVSPAGESG